MHDMDLRPCRNGIGWNTCVISGIIWSDSQDFEPTFQSGFVHDGIRHDSWLVLFRSIIKPMIAINVPVQG